MQGWYIGITAASQAVKAGSTPVPCSIKIPQSLRLRYFYGTKKEEGRRTGEVVNGAPGETRRAAAGGRWRHGAFSAAAAFARLCERRLAKAKCGKVDSFQPEVACAAAQVESHHRHHPPKRLIPQHLRHQAFLLFSHEKHPFRSVFSQFSPQFSPQSSFKRLC